MAKPAVILVGADKGGVGKTTVSRALLDYFIAHNIPTRAFDTEAPRGTEFLFNPNRFNVAISRAECLAIVVHGAELLEGAWTKIDDLRRLNLFAHAESVALCGGTQPQNQNVG